jgi:hypothetical protein
MIAGSRNYIRPFAATLVLTAAACLPSPAAAQSKPQLRLTTEILEQSYCSIGRDISLQLKLRLRYTNLSDQRLIVYNGHDLFFQTKIRNGAPPGTPSSEVLLLNMRYFDEELERIDARSPGRVFAKLAPGASFERELITGVGVADASAAPSDTTVRPGTHILQLIVSTWYQSPKLAEKLRQQWQREGFLWSQPLYSVPLKLTIDKPSTTSPCR